MDGYLIALILVVLWTAMVYYLKRIGWLERHSFSNWGPFLMWKTQGGKNVIERLSRWQRFWRWYAAVSKWVVVVAMFSMLALLVWEAFLVSKVPASSAPSPEMVLGIPGLNPLIPIWYGILGLVVAIVVHEFAHGILTRVGQMAVKSLGLVFLIFPMGAFVEPDEEAISKCDRKRRMNVFAVGPATNIMLALIVAVLFSSVTVASATALHDGPVVMGTVNNAPAQVVGIGYGYQILAIDGVAINNLTAWETFDAPSPNTTVTVTYYYNGNTGSVQVVSGVALVAVSSGLPAANAGLKAGMIIAELNGTVIHNEKDLQDALANTYPNEKVNVTALKYDSSSHMYVVATDVTNITLSSKLKYYQDNGIAVPSDFKDVGFMGINSAYLGVKYSDPNAILTTLSHPYHGVNDASSFVRATLYYIALPFYGLAPVQSPLTQLFVPTGVFAWMGSDGFWIFANCLYWIFWLNLMVGLTNALPAVPLDGGYIFRDGLDGIVERVRKNASPEQRARLVSQITMTLAFFILFLIIWQLVGPRLFGT
ncbi:MAG: Peptidase family M50 [Methanomassiliicoccales archaeon PtaU1.Bin124]|nr:MAG: Peptidase family M50 [Methanomassiliicoccales archaeon PtaU1.Bin124]